MVGTFGRLGVGVGSMRAASRKIVALIRRRSPRLGWSGRIVQLRCEPERCMLRTTKPSAHPEVVEVLKVSGDRCTVLKVVATSNAHLEDVLRRLGEHGPLTTDVVWSAALSRRPIDWEGGIPQFEAPPEWEVSWEDASR